MTPRLGFLGVGWIGRHRLGAVAESGCAEIVAVADPSTECCAAAAELAPRAAVARSLPELCDLDLDGVVIATPSAMHAEQSIAALERGLAVFCQKPLARTGAETAAVVEAARRADRPLGVDFCYRHTEAARLLRELVQGGELGRVYAAQLTFHNAYGPDKPWFYDRQRSGGGCLMDLGIHLVDMAMWVLGFPAVTEVRARLYAGGEPLQDGAVEDYATCELGLEGGASVRVDCSWNLPAGRDAIIEAVFYGTGGGVALRNVGGSFYDFRCERYRGTSAEILCEPPDAWGGRAVCSWVDELRRGAGFSERAAEAVAVASILDDLYREARSP